MFPEGSIYINMMYALPTLALLSYAQCTCFNKEVFQQHAYKPLSSKLYQICVETHLIRSFFCSSTISTAVFFVLVGTSNYFFALTSPTDAFFSLDLPNSKRYIVI